MLSCQTLLRQLDEGRYQQRLAQLYALDGTQDALDRATRRAIHVVKGFQEVFSPPENSPVALFSGPGRTEIGGNHTDHQHGHVLCASVDLDMLACAAPNDRGEICIHSEGYPTISVNLEDLLPREEERNTSAALVRGVASKISGCVDTLRGFDAYVTSNVLSGSGLSSSAAYEILIGNILNHFCGSSLSAVELAKIGQYAENIYFGKPCGLMDQMGSSIGGAVAIDFANPSNPAIHPVAYDFAASGHALCIIDTGSCHADLTDDYADITREMGAVAAHFGQKVLRDVPERRFRAAIPALRQACGDRAVLRALHFYTDDRLAAEEAQALEQGAFSRFLSLVNQSGRSSSLHLQNTWSVSSPQEQAIPLALAIGEELLQGEGAIRVHGGGFAGTIQAFVPLHLLESFRQGMESLLGQGKCHILHIRPQGGCTVIDE